MSSSVPTAFVLGRLGQGSRGKWGEQTSWDQEAGWDRGEAQAVRGRQGQERRRLHEERILHGPGKAVLLRDLEVSCALRVRHGENDVGWRGQSHWGQRHAGCSSPLPGHEAP
jgi:hypothetical protein